MQTTNVKPQELNYDKYSENKYDRDIILSIPYHKELHQRITSYVRKNFEPDLKYQILDLGVGTGITSKMLQNLLPEAEFDLVDFSEQMLKGAKKKLGTKNVNYILDDYSKLKFNKKYDLAIAVIGIHHQTDPGKKLLFKKVYNLLKPGGVFIFGDLVTHKDKFKAAANHAKHFHHLVEKAYSEKMLTDWAHHHMYLNLLAPIEDQTKWLKDAGFQVKQDFLKMNTALLICKK